MVWWHMLACLSALHRLHFACPATQTFCFTWRVFRFLRQLFFSFFKTLVGKEIVVELKNGAAEFCAPSLLTANRSLLPTDLAVRGTLHSVDQYLNVKLFAVSVEDVSNFPHMVRAAQTCMQKTTIAQRAALTTRRLARASRTRVHCARVKMMRDHAGIGKLWPSRTARALMHVLARSVLTPTRASPALRDELLYPRLGDQIRAAAGFGGGHRVVARCYAPRSRASERRRVARRPLAPYF